MNKLGIHAFPSSSEISTHIHYLEFFKGDLSLLSYQFSLLVFVWYMFSILLFIYLTLYLQWNSHR